MCTCKRSYLYQPVTPKEAAEVGRIARRLGGYDEMIRLERELREFQKKGLKAKMIRSASGRCELVADGPLPVVHRKPR